MQCNSFQIGDRVVTNKPCFIIPAGSSGTVVRVYVTLSDCYDVHVDGFSVPHLMFGADLDLVRAVGADAMTAERQ